MEQAPAPVALGWRARVNAMLELRRALLAAGETCWVYAAASLLAATLGLPRFLSPFGIWFTYWAGLEIGYYLPRVKRPWRQLQLLNLAAAIAIILVVLLFEFSWDIPLLDPAWPLVLFARLLRPGAVIQPEQVGILVLIYAYVRGARFGLRPFTLWFVGFEFRLGVLAFFIIGAVGIIAPRVDLLPPLVAYFVISLLAISLARMDESGREQGLNRRWALMLFGAILLVVLLGLFVTPFFTLTGEAILFELFSPLLPVLIFVVSLLVAPLAWVADLLFNLLSPIFQQLFQSFKGFGIDLEGVMQPARREIPSALNQLAFLLPYLQILAVVAVVLLLGLAIARALNRRMIKFEQETYIRESAEPLAAAPRTRRRPERSTRPNAQQVRAENIRRIYAALLARAAELGLPRRESETPLEFLPRLASRFPGAGADLRSITEAYIDVHYAEHTATPERVREVRTIWGRVRGQMIRSKA